MFVFVRKMHSNFGVGEHDGFFVFVRKEMRVVESKYVLPSLNTRDSTCKWHPLLLLSYSSGFVVRLLHFLGTPQPTTKACRFVPFRRFARKNSSSSERDAEVSVKMESHLKGANVRSPPAAVVVNAPTRSRKPVIMSGKIPASAASALGEASLRQHLASLNIQPTHAHAIPTPKDAEILRNFEKLRNNLGTGVGVNADTSNPQLHTMYDQYLLELLKNTSSQGVASQVPNPQRAFAEAYHAQLMQMSNVAGMDNAAAQYRAFMDAFYRSKLAEQGVASSSGLVTSAAAAAAWNAFVQQQQQQQQRHHASAAATGASALRRHSYSGVPPASPTLAAPPFVNFYNDFFAQGGMSMPPPLGATSPGAPLPFFGGMTPPAMYSPPSMSSAAAAAAAAALMMRECAGAAAPPEGTPKSSSE